MTLEHARCYFPGPACGRSDARVLRGALDEPMRPEFVERQGDDDVLIMYYPQETMIDYEMQPAGSWRCWKRNAQHAYGLNDQPWVHSWIHATGTSFDQLAERCPRAFVPRNPRTVMRWFEMVVLGALEETDDYLVSAAVDGLAYALMDREHSALPSAWEALRVWMYQHFRQELQLDDMAQRLGLKSSQFCDRFRHYFATTPMQYIQNLRLNEARYLLREPERRIADIAKEVGYEDPAYFSRLMKKTFGLSPAQLRQSKT